jgi:hypothetical protein
MAVTHASAIRNGFAHYVSSQIGASGILALFDASDLVISRLTMANASAFGAPATGVMTASAITSDTGATNNGTVTKGALLTKSSATIVRFSVSNTAGAGDVKLNSVAISIGQTVSITSLTYTAPA